MAGKESAKVVVGNAGRMLALQHILSLGLYERSAARLIDRDHFQDLPAPPNAGSLFEPMREGSGVSGGWKTDGGTSMRRMALVGAAVAVPALLGWRRLRRA